MNRWLKILIILAAAALFIQASVYLAVNRREAGELAAPSQFKELHLADISKETKPPSKLANFRLCSFQTNSLPSHQGAVFSRIAWAGSSENANDEWFEIKKISAGEINISGWQAVNKNERLKAVVAQETFLTESNPLYLLKRSVHYTGALKNNNEGLRLFDKNCQLIDEVFADSDWPAGDNELKLVMKRAGDLSWYDDRIIPASQQAQNINNGAASVVIYEIQAGSEVSTNNEYIKLRNLTEQTISLDGWSLKKKTASGKEYTLVSSSKFTGLITAQGFFVIAHKDYEGEANLRYSNTSNSLANSNNTAIIYNKSGNLISEFKY